MFSLDIIVLADSGFAAQSEPALVTLPALFVP